MFASYLTYVLRKLPSVDFKMACQHLVATVALVRAAEIISATRCPKRLRVGYIGDPRGLWYYGGIFRGLQAHAEVKWCPVKADAA